MEPLSQQIDSGLRAFIRQVLLTKSKQRRWNVQSSDTLLGGPRRGNEKVSDMGRDEEVLHNISLLQLSLEPSTC